MPDELSLGFQRQYLEKELKRPGLNPAVRRRILFLLLWDSRTPNTLLAKELKTTPKTVWTWKNQFREMTADDPGGMIKFMMKIRPPGRPGHMKEKLLAALAKIPPSEMAGSVVLSRRFKIPERTVRRLMAGMRKSKNRVASP